MLILNRSRLSKLMLCIIFLLPLFRYYNFPILGLGIETVLLLLLSMICILLTTIVGDRKNCVKSLYLSKMYFFIFFIWLFLITLFYELGTNINIHHSVAGYTINTYIMMIPIGIVFCTLIDTKVDFTFCFNIYEKFVFLIIIIYCIQWILYIMGQSIGFNIPGLEYSSSWDYLNNLTFGMNGRPTSLFSEPAHLCEYLLPYLAIVLFDKSVYKKSLLKAFVVTFVIISTTSGNGIVVSLIIWGLYFLVFSDFSLQKRIAVLIIGCICFVLIYNYLQTLPAFNKIFSELFVNTTGKYSGTKADYRVYRGFDYFMQLPIVQKIVGVGYPHMQIFAFEYGISSKFDSDRNAFEFFSTITQVMLYSGIVGTSCFVAHLVKFVQQKNYLVRGLVVCSVALWFASQMLFSNSHIMYITLIVAAFLKNRK